MNKSDSDDKKAAIFQEKIGVTPPVSAPGDTNPSDASADARRGKHSRTKYISIYRNIVHTPLPL